ncbi:MAG: glutathione S-transferase family protein [Enterovirga sp.]|nr:glutathione S-transferase family protein [Enterovirga sp.]
MITLHHCVGTRSFRALWALEELGLPYRLETMPFPPREQTPGYLADNPLGTVPLLVDGSTRMTESAAICQYLATRDGPTPLAVYPGEPDYGAFLNWLHFGEATLTFPQTIVLRYGVLEPRERRLPQAVEDYGRWYSARLRAVTEAVSGRETLCAGRFTAADISVGYALHLAEQIGLGRRFPDPVRAYWERLSARNGFRRAVAAELEDAAARGIAVTPLVSA